jgi:co-chaperonin GroES (HSP10)
VIDTQEPFDWTVQTDVRPLPDRVLVCNMEYGERLTTGGLIIPNADGKASGIHPRWATVYAVGDRVTDVQPGDRVLIAHGRWTRGVNILTPAGENVVVRMVENHSIMGVMQP